MYVMMLCKKDDKSYPIPGHIHVVPMVTFEWFKDRILVNNSFKTPSYIVIDIWPTFVPCGVVLDFLRARLSPLAVCPRSLYPFYIVTYYIKWVTTLWTYCRIVGCNWLRQALCSEKRIY